MKIVTFRDVFAERFTLGTVSIDGQHFCFSCEDADRHLEDGGKKVKRETAIPRGVYRINLSMSQRFKKLLPEFLDVPQFSGVRAHGGVDHNDTEGCILVGYNRDTVAGTLVMSQAAKVALIEKIQSALSRGEQVWWEIM